MVRADSHAEDQAQDHQGADAAGVLPSSSRATLSWPVDFDEPGGLVVDDVHDVHAEVGRQPGARRRGGLPMPGLAGSLRERDSSFRGLWPQHGLTSGRPRFNGRVRGCRVGQAVALAHDGCEPTLRGFSQGVGFKVAEAAWAPEDAGADGGAGGDTKAVQVVG